MLDIYPRTTKLMHRRSAESSSQERRVDAEVPPKQNQLNVTAVLCVHSTQEVG